jgi:hypothetical protein
VLFGLGLAVALLAYCPVEIFLEWARKRSDAQTDEDHEKAVPPYITGTFERLLAFTLVFMGVGAGAMAWERGRSLPLLQPGL